VSDARAVRTREALRQALLKLLETTPLEQISIRDIARTAGIGYRTFFRHHASKEAVLHDIAADQIQNLLQLALPVVVAGNNRAGSLALCTYVHRHRQLWRALLTGGAGSAMREEFTRLARQIAPAQPNPDRWLPEEIGVILAISSTIELLAWWLRQKQPLPVERIAEIHDRMVVTPVVNSDEIDAWRNGGDAGERKRRPPRARRAAAPAEK
jgi:AcrR family transcriptional regulator